MLHGSLSRVPLWVDEGLAEYFELPGAPGVPREDYLTDLARLLKNGWRPDLKRLELLDGVSEMQRLDYAESWAWVHWALHTHPETRKTCWNTFKTLKPPRSVLSGKGSKLITLNPSWP